MREDRNLDFNKRKKIFILGKCEWGSMFSSEANVENMYSETEQGQLGLAPQLNFRLFFFFKLLWLPVMVTVQLPSSASSIPAQCDCHRHVLLGSRSPPPLLPLSPWISYVHDVIFVFGRLHGAECHPPEESLLPLLLLIKPWKFSVSKGFLNHGV